MNKRNISTRLAIAGLLLTTIFVSCKKEGNGSASQSNLISGNSAINFTAAKTSNELIVLRNDPNANIIRTLKDFDAAAALNNNPLSKLSQKDLADFRATIVCRNGVGVVGLKYDLLEKVLSFDDFAIVLSMFGIDAKEGYWGFSKDPVIIAKLALTNTGTSGDSFVADHKEYYCSVLEPHNCKYLKGAICLSGC